MAARTQPGRRYGPAPKPAPKHRQAPTPMTTGRREVVYLADGKPMTARQERQFFRMGVRTGGFLHLGHKPFFAATPRQKKVRR